MSFSYREEQRAGQTLDVLTEEGTGVRIIVSRLGAELVSLARRRSPNEWIGYLHRDDDLTPATGTWSNHATVMGYFLHRLKNGRSLYRGQEIVGGNHGFLRTKTWHGPGADLENGCLAYEITSEDFGPTEYPLNVSLVLSYQLEGERLRITFRFHNHEPELAAHVGFGLHPGFAATENAPLLLNLPAGSYRRYFSPNNFLSGETQLFHH
ncbi:MAG TPA: hypothetical protein VK474_13205, partial [Chthoniobacterales bacterium]|nr:hypothetical protein [Chthoniobacterales bacterium]